MSALVDILYPVPEVRRSPLSMLRWWEARRPQYNFIVGSAGAITLGTLWFAGAVLPTLQMPHPAALLGLSIVYGTLANVCFSLGWLAELAARLVWGPRAPLLGPLLFREGLIFSVGLTLLPILLLWLRLVLGAVLMVVT